jgi:hypothetical protein
VSFSAERSSQKANSVAKRVELALYLGVDVGDGNGECVRIPERVAKTVSPEVAIVSPRGAARAQRKEYTRLYRTTTDRSH